MEMGAITQQYTSAEGAVGSILAGADIVLGPRYFIKAFDAVIAAVNNGTISEERINESVRRILKLRKESKRPL
jgi:beta-N-acetylhexosaminidase